MRYVNKIWFKAFIGYHIAESLEVDNPVLGFVPHVLESHLVKRFLLDTIGYVPLLAKDVYMQSWNDTNYLFTYHCPKSDILIEIYWSIGE